MAKEKTMDQTNHHYKKLPNYIKIHSSGCILVYPNFKHVLANQRPTYYIKKLMSLYLMDYHGYRKAILNVFKTNYKTPIVMNEATIFIQIHQETHLNHLWINYRAVNHYYRDQNHLLIKFLDDTILNIDVSIQVFEKQIKKIETILIYIKQNKHAIFNEVFVKE